MEYKPIDILESIFKEQITVQSIALPTHWKSLEEAKNECKAHNYDVHLVKCNSSDPLSVYIRSNDCVRPLSDEEVISESTPLIEVIDYLMVQPWLFVKERRSITGIVTKADLDSIPIRIWLFGMISLFETQLKDLIREKALNWESALSKKRLNEATSLYNKKVKSNEEVDLLSCIQISDLSSIIKKSKITFSSLIGNKSNTKITSDFHELTELRNALAHGQKIDIDWSEVNLLMKFIDGILKKM